MQLLTWEYLGALEAFAREELTVPLKALFQHSVQREHSEMPLAELWRVLVLLVLLDCIAREVDYSNQQETVLPDSIALPVSFRLLRLNSFVQRDTIVLKVHLNLWVVLEARTKLEKVKHFV